MICLTRNGNTLLETEYLSAEEAEKETIECHLCKKPILKKAVKNAENDIYKLCIKGEYQAGKIYTHYACRAIENKMNRYCFSDFDTLQVSEEMKPLINYLTEWNTDKKGAFITSACGTGKTHILIALFKSLAIKIKLENNYIIFSSLQELINDIRREMMQDSEKTLNQVLTAQVLIIDDLGIEKQTEWVSDIFFRIINGRYNNNLPIFISTNLSVQETREYIGARIVSRLYEMCEFFTYTSKDFRRESLAGKGN